MKNDAILRGYTTKETAYKVDDYPWGFRLRTAIYYWLETAKDKGDRFCSYTIDPKTGRECKPKKGTYSTFKYMFLNDKGHVVTGGIDAYDTDKFDLRFGFIIERIGEEFLSDEQKQNIRRNYYLHWKAKYPYRKVKYSVESQPLYTEWMKGKLKHIFSCEFKDLIDYPAPPAEDNPEGEIRFTMAKG